MKTRNLLIGLGLALVLIMAVGDAFAQGSGICGDQQYLYVMAGRKIMQYDLTGMTVVNTVELPEPVLPSGTESSTTAFRRPPFGSPMGGPNGVYAGESFLYVLAGPVLYRYSTPDLTLDSTVELPQPE